jgi:DNA invertase Pin-like site-specific DNA recombinase
MSGELHPPLRPPKNGHMLEILTVCRVSNPQPGKQDERSLGDQEASYHEWLKRNVGRPYDMTVIAGSGSGELLDRDDYQRLIDPVATRRYDLVLCEDLGRIVRRIHAHLVCEHCEDHNTRLYAKNDRVDTALPNWREASILAAFHHERSNRDTSERIKRTHRNRFTNGGCLPHGLYGWIKPPGAKIDTEMAERLGREQNFVARVETGQRRVDLVEWVMLCRACDVDPVKEMPILAARVAPLVARRQKPRPER